MSSPKKDFIRCIDKDCAVLQKHPDIGEHEHAYDANLPWYRHVLCTVMDCEERVLPGYRLGLCPKHHAVALYEMEHPPTPESDEH